MHSLKRRFHKYITERLLQMQTNQSNTSYEQATGAIPYNMTNDYMFRAVLQENETVLRGLISSLLHLKDSDIVSVEITNPIELGRSIDNKEFWLDINVFLNNNTKINLEMQIVNEGNWIDRSLSYLCRSYDSLYRGQKYTQALPVLHIGFLDYTLFKDAPEFYATYKMMNVKTHQLYSDKLRVGVVDLSHIELATDEDKLYGIDHWASLFKAGTWEELKAMAKENVAYEEAARTMFRLSSDEHIREQCRRREEYYQQIRTYERDLADKDALIAEQNAKLEEQSSQLEEQSAQLQEQNSQLEDQSSQLEEQRSQLQEQNAKLQEQSSQLKEQSSQLEDQSMKLQEQSALLTDKDAKIAEMEAQIAALTNQLEKA